MHWMSKDYVLKPHYSLSSFKYLSLPHDNPGFTNWGPGEPSSSSNFEDENCVETRIVTMGNGEWSTISCNEVRGFVCERESACSCLYMPTTTTTEDPKDSSKGESMIARWYAILHFTSFIFRKLIGHWW